MTCSNLTDDGPCCSEFQAADLRRGIQPVLAHQLHGVLRRAGRWTQRGPDAENFPAVRNHPGDPCLQGQGIRLHQVTKTPAGT